MSPKVIVIGGGVAGMTVAHELAEAGGFEVVVYEARDLPGGKARSMSTDLPTTPGRQPLPGEHGFRFFPGFYRHIPDTMRRIPYHAQPAGVFANLAAAEKLEIAPQDGPPMILLAHYPTSGPEWKAAFRAILQYAQQTAIPLDEDFHFVDLLVDLASSCKKRRFEEYENESWWGFSGAEQRSPQYGKYLADGLTRTLVAARAREISARTGGYILLQLAQDMGTAGMQVDRVLNGPTSEVWLDAWLDRLRELGVDYRLSHRVEEIRSADGVVTGIAGHRVSGPSEATLGEPFDDSADFYVAAVPVEVMQSGIDLGPLKATVPALQRLDKLVYRWMNGIMFYLAEDVALVPGHTIYIDSAWSLTSISQRQFWPGVDFGHLGDGRVRGILSVDISDWDTPGQYEAKGKIARDCTKEEIAAEVWSQLKAALNQEADVLVDSNRLYWFLDPDIVPDPTGLTNLEPLLINTTGSWVSRPDVELPGVQNLFLAADYVRTYTDLATMEAANEAGRRAANAIFAILGRRNRAGVWPLHLPGGIFWFARIVDAILYRLGRPPPRVARVRDGDVKAQPLRGIARSVIGR